VAYPKIECLDSVGWLATWQYRQRRLLHEKPASASAVSEGFPLRPIPVRNNLGKVDG